MVAMVSTSPLLAMVLIGLLLLGGIVLIAALLANRRTRVVGVVLLVFAGGTIVLGGLLVAWAWLGYHRLVDRESAQAEAVQQAQISRIEAEANRLASREAPPSKPALRSAPATIGPVKPTASVPAGGPKPPEKASGVLPAIGNSLAKAASETGVARASRSVKDSPGVLAASLRALSKAIAKERKRPGSGAAGPEQPAWVDAEPGLVDGLYQMTAKVTGLTRQECDEAQPEELQKAAARYVNEYLGPDAPHGIRLSPEFLQEHVVADVWEEKVTVDYGGDTGRKPTILRHVLLTFDHRANEELKRLFRLAIIRRRLRLTGFGLAAVLAAMGLAFAYLKINLATGGRYRGRLRAATVAVILAVVAANVLILAS